MAQPDNKITRLVFIVVAIFFAAKYIYAWLSKPYEASVNGTYRNECCGDIVAINGHMRHGAKDFSFKLENMKFGLTAYVNGEFTKNGGRESSEPTSLIFSGDGDHRAFTTIIDEQEYSFRRVK